MKNLKDIALIILVAAVAFFSFRDPKVIKGAEIVRTDTLYVETVRYDTIPKDTFIYVTRTVVIPAAQDVVINNDTLSQYSDSLNYEGLVIHYNMFVKGELVKFDLGYIDTRPDVIKTVTQNTTITNETVKYRNGVYIGLEIGGNTDTFNFSPKVSYLRNQWIYGYRYGLGDKTHNISIQKRLF